MHYAGLAGGGFVSDSTLESRIIDYIILVEKNSVSPR